MIEAVTQFVTKTSLNDISRDVIRVANNAIIDCVDVTVPGSREDAGQIIQRYVQHIKGNTRASLIGTDIKTTGSGAIRTIKFASLFSLRVIFLVARRRKVA